VGNFLQDKRWSFNTISTTSFNRAKNYFIALISADIFRILTKETCLNVVRKHTTSYHFG
jgi:hypothetical protein